MADDTDRIIAAQREESHKTRALLAWLLGVPLVALVIGLAIWGVIALAAHSSTETNSCADAAHSGTIDLTQCPLSGLMLSPESSCADFNAAGNERPPDGQTSPFDYFLQQYSVLDAGAFIDACQTAPQAKLAAVLQREGLSTDGY